MAKLGCGEGAEGAEGASTPLSVPAALFFSVVSLGSSMLEGGGRGRSDGTTVWTWSQLYQHSFFNFSNLILAMASCKPALSPSIIPHCPGIFDGPTLSLDGMIA